MNNKKTKILLTNDDGIYSKGIYALWEAMNEIGEVTVLAPNTEKSAVGHSITISDPIRIEPCTRHGNFKGYAVNGTPADCVKIAIGSFLDSLNTFKANNYELSKEVVVKMTNNVLDHGLPKGTLLNVNIPSCEISECNGYKVTSQGDEYFLDDLEKREDPRGRIYYWMNGEIVNNDTFPGLTMNKRIKTILYAGNNIDIKLIGDYKNE